MGQQHNKIIKRRRRKNYIARKKELAKSGAIRKSSRSGSKDAKAVKKPAAKKVAVKKPAKAVKKVEEVAEIIAAEVEVETTAVTETPEAAAPEATTEE